MSEVIRQRREASERETHGALIEIILPIIIPIEVVDGLTAVLTPERRTVGPTYLPGYLHS